LWAALAAVLPLVVLGVFVLGTRARLGRAAWITAGVAAALARWPFGLAPAGLVAAVGKGLWTGTTILLIIVPALLLYEVADRSGALARLSDGLATLAPTPARRLLLIAWIFPTFLQGAAGFGAPIAAAAPMLVRLGSTPVAAVAACLIGYHWAVTFGSMGSSFFVAAATAGLDEPATAAFALRSAGLLAVNCLAAGLLLVFRGVGRDGREALGVAVALALVMATALVATVLVQPALGSTVAGLAGLVAAWLLLPAGGPRPHSRTVVLAAAPYLVLAVLVTVGFGVPAVRSLLERAPALAPSFPASAAAFGHATPAVAAHQPLRPFLHPLPYILASAAFAVAGYRRIGWWRGQPLADTVGGWLRRSKPTVSSVLALTVVAAIMVDAGMLAVLADRLAGTLGLAYAALAPVLGAGGTVLTGSTTASNALLAPLQTRAATALGLPPTLLLAGQAAGGNVGNSLAPVNILVGAVATGCAGREGDVIRHAAPDSAALLVLVVAGVLAQVALA
jgi:lactate permease